MTMARLAEALYGAEGGDALVRVMAAERCRAAQPLGFIGAEMADHDNNDGQSWWRELLVYVFTTWLEDARRDAIRYMNEAVRVCRDVPLPSRLDAARKLKSPFEDTDESSLRDLPAQIVWDMLVLSPDVVVTDAAVIAQLRAARAALLVEQHRLVSGSLPGSLEELVPSLIDAVPEDPFDGAPLRYKLLEQGYVIYSVGQNQRDDGGSEEVIDEEFYDADIIFTVAR